MECMKVAFDLELRKNSYSGQYVALEGIDGSGKTTQVEKIASHFRDKGKEVVLTHEPRKDSLIGKLIHDSLQEKTKIPSVALQYLFSADRAVHHETIVIPALKSGKVVISDRCFWSAIPYGILDKEIDEGSTKYDFSQAHILLASQSILSFYHQFIVPDVTVYLSISVDEAMRRLSTMDKKFEIYEKKENLTKICEGYDWLISEFPEHIKKIDAERPVEEVTEGILKQVQDDRKKV